MYKPKIVCLHWMKFVVALLVCFGISRLRGYLGWESLGVLRSSAFYFYFFLLYYNYQSLQGFWLSLRH